MGTRISSHPSPQPQRAGVMFRRAAGRGFTLIETAITTVIIGVGVLALIEAQQAFLRANEWSTQSATATYLANEIRELTQGLPRHDPVTSIYFQSGPGSNVVGWGRELNEATVQDFDDLDDFDGMTFAFNGTTNPANGDLPGPIDAFGNIIPQINADGSIVTDASGHPRPLQGWSQSVRVEKVDPFNTSVVYPRNHHVPANPGTGFQGIPVDGFPLRVTVFVRYRGPFDTEPLDMATVSWIVP